jgi:hypothetical protein
MCMGVLGSLFYEGVRDDDDLLPLRRRCLVPDGPHAVGVGWIANKQVHHVTHIQVRKRLQQLLIIGLIPALDPRKLAVGHVQMLGHGHQGLAAFLAPFAQKRLFTSHAQSMRWPITKG